MKQEEMVKDLRPLIVFKVNKINFIILYVCIIILYYYIILYKCMNLDYIADIDECSIEVINRCPHKCVNTLGSFHCECPKGYYIPERDYSKCLGESLLLFCH